MKRRQPEPAVAQPPLRRRLLFVVSRDAVEHYEYLRRTLAGEDGVEVILDRRHGERRGRREPGTVERRRSDQRLRPNVEERLRTAGWSIVRVNPV
jgi:hypothetical protein